MSSNIQQVPFISHDNTPTSRKVRVIENKLTRDLNEIVSKIRTYINPLIPASELDQKFKPIYSQQIYDIIRAAATDAYTAGIEYVTNLPIFHNLHNYILVEDIDAISALADEYSARFWGRVVLTTKTGHNNKIFGTPISITRENGIEEEAPRTFLNQKYIVDSISIGVTNRALNLATVNKMRYLAEKAHVNPLTFNLSNIRIRKPRRRNEEKVRIAQAAVTKKKEQKKKTLTAEEILLMQQRGITLDEETDSIDIDETTSTLNTTFDALNLNLSQEGDPITGGSAAATLSTALGLGVLNNIIDTATKVDVMWVTEQDDRTCPICEPLHGTTYNIYDDFYPVPVEDTHSSCRCRLIIVGPNGVSEEEGEEFL